MVLTGLDAAIEANRRFWIDKWFKLIIISEIGIDLSISTYFIVVREYFTSIVSLLFGIFILLGLGIFWLAEICGREELRLTDEYRKLVEEYKRENKYKII